MTSDQVVLRAPAKINLTLHVTGQRADGYHLLDSLVVFADLGDEIVLTPAAQTSLTINGPFAEGVPADARNLVWKAMDLVGQPHQITLTKNLPNGAGIGGGSADAAAVLRHFGATAGAAGLGADVPVCLRLGAQRMRGVGEQLDPVPGFPTLHAVLVNPGVSVATPQIFAALSSKSHPPMPECLPQDADSADIIGWLAKMRNDLEGPAQNHAPQISQVLAALRNTAQASLVRMSGSGATCFAIFPDATSAQDAAAQLASDHPDWWVRATRLNSPG